MKRPMTRRRWRRILLLTGTVPALAALLFTAMVVRFLAIQHSGANAYTDEQYLDAAGVSGSVIVDSPIQVTVTVTLKAQTAFLSIIGIDTFTVHGKGTATVTAVN